MTENENLPETESNTPRGAVVSTEVHVDATPQRLWETWADADRISEWFVDRAAGQIQPGGACTWFWDSFGFEIPLRVVAAEPEESFMLAAELGGESTRNTEVRLERRDGGTMVSVREWGFHDDSEESIGGVESGWGIALQILKLYTERYFGSPRTHMLHVHPARFDYGTALGYFTDEDKLAQWLTSEGLLPGPGDPYELELRDGSVVSGRVLANTGREVVAGWEQIQGTLGFKAFGVSPDQRFVGVEVNSWDPKFAADSRPALDPLLQSAVANLAARLEADS